MSMKKKATRTKTPPLSDGQVWQMKDCYIQITHLGKTLVEYKMMAKLGQKAVRSQMGSIAATEAYLRTNQARLLSNPTPSHSTS
jgi:hypothetical protein